METNDGKNGNAIVLLVDGLNPRFLSPYGCTWVETPGFDQLASQSIVFENAIAESVQPDAVCQSFLSGRHPALNIDLANREKVATKGQSILISDNILAFGDTQGFDSVCKLDYDANCDQAASEITQTVLARTFASALQEIEKQASPFLAVLHLTSLNQIWDAPSEMREKYRDDEDPDAATFVVVPNKYQSLDPDQQLSLTHAYAAQIETLDACLQFMLDELTEAGLLDNSFLMLGGLRGFPVGLHQQIGHADDHLHSDATSVPLIVRIPESSDVVSEDQISAPCLTGSRCHSITSATDWFSWVESWLVARSASDLLATSVGMPGSTDTSRKYAVVFGNDRHAIRTPAWLLVQVKDGTRMFLKPEDRWDINPIQDRCRWIAQDLEDLLIEACDQLRRNEPISIELLAEEMVLGIK